MDAPEIHYARSGDVAIAYQVVGEGTIDLVFVPTFANLVFPWLNQDWKSFYRHLASFARLIMLDKRGTGLSDRPRDLGSLEARMDDIRAVLDAVGAERAVLIGSGAGGQSCAMFAATYPERTRALVLVNTPARGVKATAIRMDSNQMLGASSSERSVSAGASATTSRSRLAWPTRGRTPSSSIGS